uniref:Uncharacterized protein n=1 Tax=Meloidogyne hapla TaxID=6305 RepID=A0A1I8B676_MELHA
MLKSAQQFLVFSFIHLSYGADWVIDGDIECKEIIHGFGEFSFLLQEAIIRFYEQDNGQNAIVDKDDDLLFGKHVLTDSFGHFNVKGHDYENICCLEPYLQIDHLCYTPNIGPLLMGCYYRTRIDLQPRPDRQNVHIILGIQSAKQITENEKDLKIVTTMFCPEK